MLFHHHPSLFRRAALDARLAGGEAPSGDPALARRAAQLCRPRRRRSVAAGFERVLADDGGGYSAAIPVDRRAVTAARPYLAELISVLRSSKEVAPHGVARAGRLLTDIASPLYRPEEPTDLHEEMRLILFWLDPAPIPADAGVSPPARSQLAR